MMELNRGNIRATMSAAKIAKTPPKSASVIELTDVRTIDPVQKWWLDA